MSDWTLPAVLVAGIGLGVVFAIAAAGWFVWVLYGRNTARASSEAWQNKLSQVFNVAPPSLPPLDPPRDIEPRNIGLWQQDQAQGLGQVEDEYRKRGLS